MDVAAISSQARSGIPSCQEEGRTVLTSEIEPHVAPNADTNLLNLLIVDDERAVRESCRDVSQTLGFATRVADSPDHCYRILDTMNVDVVLLDLRLPGTNGMEVLREIKRRRPDTVVVIMTGFATVQSAVQAMKSGAYDYVTKPFTFDELRLVLDRVTAHLQMATENRLLREQVKSAKGRTNKADASFQIGFKSSQ